MLRNFDSEDVPVRHAVPAGVVLRNFDNDQPEAPGTASSPSLAMLLAEGGEREPQLEQQAPAQAPDGDESVGEATCSPQEFAHVREAPGLRAGESPVEDDLGDGGSLAPPEPLGCRCGCSCQVCEGGHMTNRVAHTPECRERFYAESQRQAEVAKAEKPPKSTKVIVPLIEAPERPVDSEGDAPVRWLVESWGEVDAMGVEVEPMVLLGIADCVDAMRQMPDSCIDAIVCDPPYGLEFMGKEWDRLRSRSGTKWTGEPESPILGVEQDDTPQHRARIKQPSVRPLCMRCGRGASGQWGRCECDEPLIVTPNFATEQQAFHLEWSTEAFRVLKPGGHLLAFGGTRTYHRMACAIEDAGFEVRDCLSWMYGSGFPKSMDPHKKDTRIAEGLGTALKPSWEPIVMARKPLIGTVVRNVLEHGTGALNIDACRIDAGGDKLGGGAETKTSSAQKGNEGWTRPWMENEEQQEAHAARVRDNVVKAEALGRWPANTLLTHHEDCVQVGEVVVQSGSQTADRPAGPSTPSWNGAWKARAGSSIGVEVVGVWECVEGVWVPVVHLAGIDIPLADQDGLISQAVRLLESALRATLHSKDNADPQEHAPASGLASFARPQGWTGGCPACSDSGGELLRVISGASQESPQQLADALERALEWDAARSRSRRHQLLSHPSSSGDPLGSGLSLDMSESRTESVDLRDEPLTGRGDRTLRSSAGQSPAERVDSTRMSSRDAASDSSPRTFACIGDRCGEHLRVAEACWFSVLVWLPRMSWSRHWIVEPCPVRMLDEQTGVKHRGSRGQGAAGYAGGPLRAQPEVKPGYGDQGGASRFFYAAKVAKKERNLGLPPGTANDHPTVKPIEVMRWLVRMVTPPGGVVLDPFMGSGTTGIAALREGFAFIGIEKDEHYATDIARRRIGAA